MNILEKCAVSSLLGATLLLSAAPRVLATASSSAQMRDTEKQRAARLEEKQKARLREKKSDELKDAAAWHEIEEKRARREIAAIYDAMAAAQKRGDLNATQKYFAPDIQIVTDSGARLGAKDLQRVLALPAPAMRLDSVRNTITGFARRGALADAKVSTRIAATSRKKGAAKPQNLMMETLRREVWRRDKSGWKLIFSKTLAQITRAK